MNEYPYHKSLQSYTIMQQYYDAALEGWAIPPQSVYLETIVGLTHMLKVGDDSKPALFYFHGWNGNASGNNGELDLERLIPHYCIYMPDTPGHTGRSEQVRPDTVGRAYADWVGELLDKLSIDRAYLAGISGGAYIMLKATAHLQERVIRSLGIVPYGIPPTRRPPLKFWRVVVPMMFMGQRGARLFARKLAAAQGDDADYITGFVDFMQVMNKHFKPSWNPAPLTDEELQAIDAPLDFIFAENDITMNTSVAVNRAKRFVPHAKVQILPQEGHILSPIGIRIANDILVSWQSAQVP